MITLRHIQANGDRAAIDIKAGSRNPDWIYIEQMGDLVSLPRSEVPMFIRELRLAIGETV